MPARAATRADSMKARAFAGHRTGHPAGHRAGVWTDMRTTFAALVLSVFSLVILGSAPLQAAEWRHGLSLFGSLKYDADFPHFDYVNPDAPKGGQMRRATIGGFDTLNQFNIKGRPDAFLSLIYDTLLESTEDEASSSYGLLSEAVKHPDDYSSVTYKLRSEARWHDGKPVTAEDVIWTLEALKKNSPFWNKYYQHVERAEETAPREITFFFDQTGNRELPLIVGQMPILPKHYWTGTNANGELRDISTTTLEPPLGSGPYRIAEVKPGRSVRYERVEDYWGRDLPVNVGRHNFDAMQLEYFRDVSVLFEAFKGDQYDLRFENSAKRWATGYDFAAVTRGDVVRETASPERVSGMQAFVFNTRLEKFADSRVRQAFNYAFNFQWLNENVFYNQYKRTESFFQNSELQATGLPSEAELALLEPLRDKIPPEVFTTEYRAPVGGNQRAQRTNLRTARALLAEAGWTIQDGVLKNASGEQMTLEFLLVSPDFERIVGPYLQELKKLGVEGTIRVVDTAQYQNRIRDFDFEVITDSFGQSLSPGNEQLNYWSTAAADRVGSDNTIGIRDEAVDALVNAIIFAEDRPSLVAATQALDRVLLWNHFVVPQFYSPDVRLAYWNRYGHPPEPPRYGIGATTWWWDAEKAAKIEASN
jgi:microcin C transport system substrate-binding protein